MFQINDLIIFGNSGVCKVESIGVPNISGIEKGKQYYTLKPIYSKGSVVYTPVDNPKASMRKVITNEQAQELLDNILSVPMMIFDNEKYIDEKYRMAINSQDCEELIKVIKTVYIKQQHKIREGKKLSQTEEKYMRLAEDMLYSELAIALNMPKDQMKSYIDIRTLQS